MQDRIPRKNDRVAFFSQETGGWKTVKLSSNVVRGWNFYYNYIDEENCVGGVYLIPDERWTFLHDDNIQDDHEAVPDQQHIQQVDGFAGPTPDTSPGTGARPKTNVRFGPTEYVQSSSDSEPSAGPGLNDALSMDWDAFGTELECSVSDDASLHQRFPLNKVVNLDRIPLDKVVNLDTILPLTSTPLSSPENNTFPTRRQRTSMPRRPLPIELEDSEPSFLSRLNPFRKRK